MKLRIGNIPYYFEELNNPRLAFDNEESWDSSARDTIRQKVEAEKRTVRVSSSLIRIPEPLNYCYLGIEKNGEFYSAWLNFSSGKRKTFADISKDLDYLVNDDESWIPLKIPAVGYIIVRSDGKVPNLVLDVTDSHEERAFFIGCRGTSERKFDYKSFRTGILELQHKAERFMSLIYAGTSFENLTINVLP